MKIIYYSPHPTHDIVSEVGYSTHQRETIEAMRELGHEVLPVIMGGTDAAKVQDFHRQITSETGWKKALKKWIPKVVLNSLKDLLLLKHDKKAAATLHTAILEFQPDLVYERNEYMQSRGTALTVKLGVRHFLEVNSPCVAEMREFEGPALLSWIGHRHERKKLRLSNHIFTVSNELKQFILQKYRPVADITVIPNCINPVKEKWDIERMGELKKALQLENKFVVGFVGSMFPYHGVDKLIHAFVAFAEKNPNAFLLVVGGGGILEELKQLAGSILPEQRFYFTGKIPHTEVMNYIGIFDIAVMPSSNWYGSPIKILEYGIMRKPIIAPDNGPLNDLITHGETGFLHGIRNGDLNHAMVWMANHPELARDMGEKFYSRILNEFTWTRQAQTILGYTS